MFPGWKFYVEKRGGKEERKKLKSIEFLILSHINAEGPINGYNIMTNLRDQFKDLWNPSPGTVYNQLENLEKKGLISHKLVDTDKEHLKSKEYFLIQKGKEVLKKIITVETAEKEFEAIGDYVKTIMQRLPFDKRIGPFFRFINPLFEILEPLSHPPPPDTPPPPPFPDTSLPPPDYRSYIDALKDFKHACMNYCSYHEEDETEEQKESKIINIQVKGDDEE
jgi:DNA-binding PadR family transcriptional regulator